MSAVAHENRFAQDLALVAGENESRAKEAFGRMCDLVRPAALRRLIRNGAAEPDAEDAVQTAFADLWRSRGALRARTGGEWYALVRKSVGRAHFRRWRKESVNLALAHEWGVAVDDLPYLDAALAAADQGRIGSAADGLWLGEAEEPGATLGAAAVQLALLEGLAPDDAAATFGLPLVEIERWLDDPAVVARALYSALCWSGDDLAGYVLRPERPLLAEEMDVLMKDGGSVAVPSGWTLEDARVVCWRLRNGLHEREIERASDGALSPREIETALAKVRDALPYARIAFVMRRALEERGNSDPMRETGLWKRMAFEYALREIPQRQMMELAGPPAEVAPFPLTSDRINNWLSGGRLVRQLAAYLREKDA